MDLPYDRSCPFCAIVRGEDARAEVICVTESWVAFFPDAPATPGHTLIVPVGHYSTLWSAPVAVAQQLMLGAWTVGTAAFEALRPSGMNLITSAGTAAEQSVPHVHLHVVPRWNNDRIGRIWPPKRRLKHEMREDLAEAMRAACRTRQT